MWRNEMYMGFTVNTLCLLSCLKVYWPVFGYWKLKTNNKTWHLYDGYYSPNTKKFLLTDFNTMSHDILKKQSFYFSSRSVCSLSRTWGCVKLTLVHLCRCIHILPQPLIQAKRLHEYIKSVSICLNNYSISQKWEHP